MTRRNHREHLRSAHGWPRRPVDCPCDLQAGRFRKKDAYDCGQPRCRVCHHYKFLHRGRHEPTRQELLADRRQREQLRDEDDG